MSENQAVIFKMSVISNVREVHTEIDSMLLFNLGVELSEKKIEQKYQENMASKCFSRIIDEHGLDLDIDREKWMKDKWWKMECLPPEKFKEAPGATKLIDDICLVNLPRAVATYSRRTLMNKILARLMFVGRFSETLSIFDRDIVQRNGEAEIFLHGAERLGAFPEKTVVIADDMETMLAVKEVGMKCIGIVPNRRWSTPADWNVVSLRELNPDLIQGL